MEVLIVILIILLVIFALIVGIYNTLVKLRNRVKEKWSQVNVMLKRRFDLIPNLVETVKGYASHEKETFEAVINARNMFANAKSIKEQIDSSNKITETLGKLFALSEAYPDLKANENFLRLQSDLKDTEDKISTSRTMYNDDVTTYNNKVQQFPSNIVASMFKFLAADFFETNEAEKETPKVQF